MLWAINILVVFNLIFLLTFCFHGTLSRYSMSFNLEFACSSDNGYFVKIMSRIQVSFYPFMTIIGNFIKLLLLLITLYIKNSHNIDVITRIREKKKYRSFYIYVLLFFCYVWLEYIRVHNSLRIFITCNRN